MYIKVLKVMGKVSYYITSRHFIVPAGEEVFAVLGVDRILYVPIDSNIGREYAVRVVKKTAWNVKKVKVWKTNVSAVYSIPKAFAKSLGIKKGDLVLVVGRDNTLEIIPVRVLLEKIGKFREPMLM